MITAVVQFKLPDGTSLDDARALFQSTAPRYRGMQGLVRKYYLFDAENRTGGGCYLFESRDKAEATFDKEWHERIRDKYGADPVIQYFESPVIVDNIQGQIIGGADE